MSRYSFRYRPAWRIIQTGVRSTGWRRHARSNLSFIQNRDDTIPRFMEASETSVSIVVPAFNEAGRIAESVSKIDAFIRRSPVPLDLIIVDDGSTDKTAEIISGLNAKSLRLIRNDEN